MDTYHFISNWTSKNTHKIKLLNDNIHIFQTMGIYKCIKDDIKNNSKTDKCIVLDLDETLIHTSERISQLGKTKILSDSKHFHLRDRIYMFDVEDIVDEPGKGNTAKMWGVKRPGLHEFLLFCFSHFKIVAVWSAGKPRYVEAICNEIFKDVRDPHIIYTWDHCEKYEDRSFNKPLSKIIKEFNDDRMNLSNTLAIDDRESTFSGVNKDNGILIPRYEPTMNVIEISKDETSLKELQKWFERDEFLKCKDVRKLNKDGIFKSV